MELNPAKYKKEVAWSEEDNCFVARAPELPGCATDGATEAEALENLNEALVQHLEAIAEFELEQADGKSKFLLRMPARLKQLLVKTANDRDLSINELLLDYINLGLESAARRKPNQEVVAMERVKTFPKSKLLKKGLQSMRRKVARRSTAKRSAG